MTYESLKADAKTNKNIKITKHGNILLRRYSSGGRAYWVLFCKPFRHKTCVRKKLQ